MPSIYEATLIVFIIIITPLFGDINKIMRVKTRKKLKDLKIGQLILETETWTYSL